MGNLSRSGIRNRNVGRLQMAEIALQARATEYADAQDSQLATLIRHQLALRDAAVDYVKARLVCADPNTTVDDLASFIGTLEKLVNR